MESVHCALIPLIGAHDVGDGDGAEGVGEGDGEGVGEGDGRGVSEGDGDGVGEGDG